MNTQGAHGCWEEERVPPLSRDHSATDRIERARWRVKKEEDLTTDGGGGG